MAERAQGGEGFRLPVQPPDPRPVLGRAQPVGEVKQPPVQQPPVVEARPGERVVHRGGAVGGQDRGPGVAHHPVRPVRHPAYGPCSAVRLDMVGAHEVAAQRLGPGHQPLVVPGGQPVVAVQEGDVLAAGGLQTGVTRGRQTAVHLVPQQHGPGDLVGGPAQQPGCPVGRTVVDEKELEVLAGVGPQTSEGVGRVGLHVEERHDDGELNHAHHVRGGSGSFLFRNAPSR